MTAERLVAAALANNRGFFSTIGVIDADKVAILEMALARLPTDDPERALVLATLCSELAFGSSLERRQALADEAMAIAESSGDDAIIVRVLNQRPSPTLRAAPARAVVARTDDALVRAERVGDPVLLFLAARLAPRHAARAGDIDEMDRCLESWGPWPSSSTSPCLNWVHAQGVPPGP